MREIKFRAWDGISMRADFWLKLDGDLCQWDYHDTMFKGNIKGIELMQYTGLKDKNGVEIYEGDICTDIERIADSSNVEVFWSDKLAGFMVCNTPRTWSEFLERTAARVEVIGNIHENSGLLK